MAIWSLVPLEPLAPGGSCGQRRAPASLGQITGTGPAGALAAAPSLDMPWPFPLSLKWYLGVALTGILGTNLGESKTHPHLTLQASAPFHVSLSLFQDELWMGDFYFILP